MAGGYIPLGSRPRHAIAALFVALVANLIVIVTDLGALHLLDDPTDLDALRRFDDVTGTASLVCLASIVLCAIFFIRWFNLVHRNLDALWPGVRRHETSWSIGGWFVPVLALVRPKQILDDMLDCTQGAGSRPSWATWWWGLWITGSLLSNFVVRVTFNADTLESFRNATIADAAASALLVACAALAVTVVRRISEAMERKQAEPATALSPEIDPAAVQPWPSAAEQPFFG